MKRITIASLCLMLLLASSPVLALGLGDAGSFAAETASKAQINTRQSLESIVADVISILLGLVGIIFMLLSLYGGYIWMTSAGEPDKIKKAKGLILNGAIGMLIILTAYSITYFVARQIESAIP